MKFYTFRSATPSSRILMENIIFRVNDIPYCIWDEDLRGANKQFLGGIDPSFFQYATDAHLTTVDEKRAAVALKLCLHHSLETFFSLLGAYLQAPECGYAWLPKCDTSTLRVIIGRIHRGDSDFPTRFNIQDISWNSVSEAVHVGMCEMEVYQQAVSTFAKLWSRLAEEFLEPSEADEYNSLKHGFRVSSGGFKIEFAMQREDGNSPSEEDFRTLGSSVYGSSHFKIDPLTKKSRERSLKISRHANNWSLEKIVILCKSVHLSINNVVSALRIFNDCSRNDNSFLYPINEEQLLSAWNYTPAVTSSRWSSSADESNCPSLTKEQLLKRLADLTRNSSPT